MPERLEDARNRPSKAAEGKFCDCCGEAAWHAERGSGLFFNRQGWRWLCRRCWNSGCSFAVPHCKP